MKEADKELLLKYLYNTGGCTPGEMQKVHELLDQQEAQQFIRDISLNEWDKPVLLDEMKKALYKSWKEKANDHITSQIGVQNKKNTLIRRMRIFRYAAIWAAVLILPISAVILMRSHGTTGQLAYVQKHNERGAPLRYVLPDGSEVYLSAGSTLSYPEHFESKRRDIKLEGEAFFQVAHEEDRPFIIQTGEIHTQVLGTSFKVTDVNGRNLEVAVATGKVSVSRFEAGEGKVLATLTPGNKVTWDQANKKASLGQVDVDELLGWKSGDMVFDHLTMAQITHELQQRYGVSFLFEAEAVKQHQVTATFSGSKAIDKIMKTLELAGKFKYRSTDNKTFTIYEGE